MDKRICVLVCVVSGHSDVMCDVLTKQETPRTLPVCTIVVTTDMTWLEAEEERKPAPVLFNETRLSHFSIVQSVSWIE